MKNLIILLRPHQWLKNLFVFLPLFFGGHLLEVDCLLAAMAAFAAFCMAAGSIYCFNDLMDAEADRRHPVKRLRPIAAGLVTAPQAYALMAFLLAAAAGFCLLVPADARVEVMLIIGLYYLLNIAYTLWLKHMAIIDVFVIAIGFVLRVFVGGSATGVTLSVWIVMMTFLLALFLAFAKRRDDVKVFENTGVKARANIANYNLVFINQVIAVLASITMVCYIMYTVSPEVMARFDSRYVYLTAIFVLAGIIRYLQLTIVAGKSGSPTKVLLGDRFIQCCILCWIASFAVIIYAAKF